MQVLQLQCFRGKKKNTTEIQFNKVHVLLLHPADPLTQHRDIDRNRFLVVVLSRLPISKAAYSCWPTALGPPPRGFLKRRHICRYRGRRHSPRRLLPRGEGGTEKRDEGEGEPCWGGQGRRRGWGGTRQAAVEASDASLPACQRCQDQEDGGGGTARPQPSQPGRTASPAYPPLNPPSPIDEMSPLRLPGQVFPPTLAPQTAADGATAAAQYPVRRQRVRRLPSCARRRSAAWGPARNRPRGPPRPAPLRTSRTPPEIEWSKSRLGAASRAPRTRRANIARGRSRSRGGGRGSPRREGCRSSGAAPGGRARCGRIGGTAAASLGLWGRGRRAGSQATDAGLWPCPSRRQTARGSRGRRWCHAGRRRAGTTSRAPTGWLGRAPVARPSPRAARSSRCGAPPSGSGWPACRRAGGRDGPASRRAAHRVARRAALCWLGPGRSSARGPLTTGASSWTPPRA
eukprot:scaffold13664_cov89-Isochrysis_galbana.AAC.4